MKGKSRKASRGKGTAKKAPRSPHARAAENTVENSVARVGPLRDQMGRVHGGNPGNKGGPGRPPNELVVRITVGPVVARERGSDAAQAQAPPSRSQGAGDRGLCERIGLPFSSCGRVQRRQRRNVPHCGQQPEAGQSLLPPPLEVAIEHGADEAELRRMAREVYVRVPHMIKIAAGETTCILLDAQGGRRSGNELLRRITAFNVLARSGLGIGDGARDMEILVDHRSALEEEVRAHFGLTLGETWVQCRKAGPS
jgi:hypothetical protein